MVLWFVVNRDPEDYATAFAAEALVGEVVWTAYCVGWIFLVIVFIVGW